MLPPIFYAQKTSTGEVIHSLAEARSVSITSSRELRVSPRCTETLLTLDTGESVIVTERKLPARPPEADGVLRLVGGRHLKWVYHKLLEEFEREVAEVGWEGTKKKITATWENAFRFKSDYGHESAETPQGLRAAQLGALHAIGAHWSLQKQAATVIMPTGTGKTETMIATLVAFVKEGTLLVIVPSRVLREQTARKFEYLGLLRQLGVLLPDARNPIVGLMRSRPQTERDLDVFEHCHIVLSTINALGQGQAVPFGGAIAERVSALFVDEAHHVPADSWSTFREHFKDKRVLQFTATPFRRDGKLVDGRVIYNYPLRTAQQDGYFKPISFEPVFEIDPEDGDRAIAESAIGKLKTDLAAGRNHLLMARCDSIDRARTIHDLYEGLAPEFAPLLVHSEAPNATASVDQLRSGGSRIVVCVDMLGEGFDLPQLKVAAIHDTHKSLAILLQFTGRFTRTADPTVGDATVIANIANQEVSAALERLYSEDADWNHLLSEFSSEAVKEQFALSEFLRNSERLGEEDEEEGSLEISHHLLRPKFSTVAYSANQFRPKRFYEGLSADRQVQRVWLHKEGRTLYFVTRLEPHLLWTRSHDLTDRQWDLFILHYDPTQKLLYLHSSDKSSTYDDLAKAVAGQETRLIYGDTVFRTLGRINRLQFQNIGVKKHGRRNLRYAMYTGADVAQALGLAERAGSEKSNLYGGGWEAGKPVTIGCSYKGRVWSREQGTIPEFVRWATGIGAKLQDNSIDTRDILQHVLIPEEVEQLPDSPVLSIEWPIEILHQPEERVVLSSATEELPISMFTISAEPEREAPNRLKFTVASEVLAETLVLELGGDNAFTVKHASGNVLLLKIGGIKQPLADYLTNYPPLIRFIDMAELDGDLLVRPREAPQLMMPPDRFEVWDWRGMDVAKESIWKEGEERRDSIQGRAAARYEEGGFEVIFDDDSPGEAADLVCLKETEDYIRLALVHCKFTSGAAGGERVKDVVEVCSQAVRSSKWKWRFRELCRHLTTREKRLRKPYRDTRFLVGSAKDLNRFLAMSRFKEVRAEIVVVQPGLSKDRCTPDQNAVLAAAHSFLKETVDTDLDVICSE